MKKTIAVAVFLFAIAVTDTFGQTGLLNTNKYFQIFSIKKREDIANSDYVWEASDEEIGFFGQLNWNGKQDDDTGLPDIPIEFALLSYYSPVVIQIRPAEAKAMLPADNPKLAGLKLGTALYQEIQVLRFLASTGSSADTNAVGRYESMLKFVCDRNKVTPAEIEAYYRNGIRGFIAEIVDEEFNKISTGVLGTNGGGCNGTLIRRQGHYILECEGFWGEPGAEYSGQGVRGEKDFTGTTLDQLITTMQRSGLFSSSAYNEVKAQAKLIPAVAYPASTLADVVNIITSFYLNPSQSALSALRVKYRTFQLNEGDKGEAASESLYKTIRTLNPALSDSMISRR
jgi:hypothetical protein